jgi:hypothetical protein
MTCDRPGQNPRRLRSLFRPASLTSSPTTLMLSKPRSPDKTIAFLLEPIQGEGGREPDDQGISRRPCCSRSEKRPPPSPR